jgi:predicted transcriptional regulator
MTVYGLSKILGWSTGKVYHSIKRLEEAKMIRENEEISSGRIIKRIVPVEWTEYFTKEELEDLKNWSGNK